MDSPLQHTKPDFADVFEDNYEIIYRYLYRRFADEDVAADLASITFIKAHQAYDRFEPTKPVLHWLYRIAGNELKMYFRAHKRHIESLDKLLEDGVELADPQSMTEDIIAAEDWVDRHRQFLEAQRLLLALPQKYQEVIMLRFIEKRSIAEIASILGKKEGTVKSILSRGLKKLRTQLKTDTMQPNLANGINHSEGHTNKVIKAYEE